MVYELSNDTWILVQVLNPLVERPIHLTGEVAIKNDYFDSAVNTSLVVAPIFRAKGFLNSAPQGIMPRLNASQFSTLFKGTPIARMSAQNRGRLNRGYNLGSNQVQTGNILFKGTKKNN